MVFRVEAARKVGGQNKSSKIRIRYQGENQRPILHYLINMQTYLGN